MKDISIIEFARAKNELRNNIREAVVMFVEDFHRKTGVHPDGTIAFEQQYYDDETDATCETRHLGMAVEVLISTSLEYDD